MNKRGRRASPPRLSPSPAPLPPLRTSPTVHDILADYAALPIDVLRIILAHLPRQPRISVASLVCKRWRAAALNITTCLVPLTVSRALRHLLPSHNVTRLGLLHPPHRSTLNELALPFLGQVRALTLHRPPHNCGHFASSLNLSTLTSLKEFNESSLPICFCLNDLIHRNAATLTTLALRRSVVHATQAYVALATPLPSLTSLTLDVPTPAVSPIIHRLSSQLVELRVLSRDDCKLSRTMLFPRLTRLEAAVPQGFAPCVPALLSLVLHCGRNVTFIELDDTLRTLGVTLRGIVYNPHIRFDVTPLIEARLAFVPHLTQLTTSDTMLSVWRSALPRLRSLELVLTSLRSLHHCHAELTLCTALSSLALHVSIPPGFTDAGDIVQVVRLPLTLERFAVHSWNSWPMLALSQLILPLVSQCPRLTTLTLNHLGWLAHTREKVEALGAFVAALSLHCHALRTLRLSKEQLTATELRAMRARSPWLQIKACSPGELEVTDARLLRM